ncbi:MAG: hypothetical protein NVV82_00190 [Sporocytophaga sp.]|nr:hypothetical protein [Sporocytophaga sp.]
MVKFKIDVQNNTGQDIEFALFGTEQVTGQSVSLEIAVPGNPVAAVYNPSNGFTYRTIQNDAIIVTDSNNTIIASIPGVGIWGSQGVYNPFNQTVYFTTFSNKIIAIKELVLTEIPTPGMPSNGVYCPVNNSVYFSNSDFTATRLYKLDPNNILSFIPVPSAPAGLLQGSRGVFFEAEDTLVFGCNGENQLYVFNPFTDLYITTIPLQSRPKEAVLNPANNKVYFSSFGNQIYELSLGNVLNALLLPVGQEADFGTYSPSDNIVYFVSVASQEFLYMIDSGSTITSIPLVEATQIIYNTIDEKIYVPTTSGISIVKNGSVIQTLNVGELGFPVLNPVTGVISFRMSGSNRLFFYGNAGLNVSKSQLESINGEINSGAFKIDELKIIATDPGQFSFPIQLIKKTLTGSASVEPVFPIDKYGVYFKQNVITLSGHDLQNFVASLEDTIKTTIKANTLVSFVFSGTLTKFSDGLTKKNIQYYE